MQQHSPQTSPGSGAGNPVRMLAGGAGPGRTLLNSAGGQPARAGRLTTSTSAASRPARPVGDVPRLNEPPPDPRNLRAEHLVDGIQAQAMGQRRQGDQGQCGGHAAQHQTLEAPCPGELRAAAARAQAQYSVSQRPGQQ